MIDFSQTYSRHMLLLLQSNLSQVTKSHTSCPVLRFFPATTCKLDPACRCLPNSKESIYDATINPPEPPIKSTNIHNWLVVSASSKLRRFNPPKTLREPWAAKTLLNFSLEISSGFWNVHHSPRPSTVRGKVEKTSHGLHFMLFPGIFYHAVAKTWNHHRHSISADSSHHYLSSHPAKPTSLIESSSSSTRT